MSDTFLSLDNTFIIAEIGQNHQGDINTAKKIIDAAKECGANCVKFQKTDLIHKFNNAALEKPYSNPNAFGKTYGEHKEFLEFNKEEFRELQNYAKEKDILFTASAMDCPSLEYLASLNVPFIKIGSGDCNNLKLIEMAAKTNIPLIISTGMQSFETVKTVYNLVSTYHKNFSILHCVSAYPTPFNEINLNVIRSYKNEFPTIKIGYSGHELEFYCTVAAVAMGAQIIERHITLDKTQKGSDHICSLEPHEFKTMVNQIRNLEIALGSAGKMVQNCEMACYKKLGKSIVVSKDLKKGHLLQDEDIVVKVAEPKGIDGVYCKEILGRALKKDMKNDESLLEEFLKE